MGCDKGGPARLAAFVGSASKPAMEEAAAAFEKETGIKVYLNFGGSGAMLSQMELSQSGDLYIPGSQDYIAKAERKGIIDIDSVVKIAYLIPVISVQLGNPKNIRTLADLARPGLEIGIGNPQSVCLGLYAIEIFEYNGLLEDISKNIAVNAESCSKTAVLISLQSVDAVIGWDVFHYWDPDNIDTVYIDPAQLPRLAYVPGAITKYAADRENASRFLDFLVSEEGRQIFQKWGYITTDDEARTYAPGAEIGGEYELPDSYQP
ncbi:MAG: molybdate ABC transporter substrate-binding protein [Dehalococcoidales bacterium]|nr:molybdate ABC transporter substrate-binding protein [Dehalococcoidales bacterium]